MKSGRRIIIRSGDITTFRNLLDYKKETYEALLEHFEEIDKLEKILDSIEISKAKINWDRHEED